MLFPSFSSSSSSQSHATLHRRTKNSWILATSLSFMEQHPARPRSSSLSSVSMSSSFRSAATSSSRAIWHCSSTAYRVFLFTRTRSCCSIEMAPEEEEEEEATVVGAGPELETSISMDVAPGKRSGNLESPIHFPNLQINSAPNVSCFWLGPFFLIGTTSLVLPKYQ
ncbi:hypothetical protein Tsubulata_005351 [Turnera subulata]|uniref:Uncharacterized protein n=1 Tax=Turnera subulata TaxID=218843 RepID=A0A9Q0GDF6_9ROSI|nr:hypothetical protein Tsubulata_005351 [Turnera subulata]